MRGYGGVRSVVRHSKSRRIGRAAAALGAMLFGLAFTTSVAGALIALPDVTISMAPDGARPLAPGSSFTWTIIARNSGAATAHDVVVSSSLPAGVALVSPPPGCLVGSAVRCPVGDLGPDGQVRIQLALHLQEGTCGQLRSLATVSASDEPAIAGNDDTAVASASVGCLATTPDLVVEATSDAAGRIKKGDAVRYSLTVANAGAGVAHHVIVTDRLPPRVEPINLLPKMDGGSCSAVGSTEGRAAFTIVCRRSTLDAGASATVTIDVRVEANRPCGPMRNRATVSANDEPAAARANDSASHVDHVLCAPSLRVSGDGPRAARVGEHVRSVFAVTNDGEVPLHDIAFRGTGCDVPDRLHPGLLRPGRHWSVTCARTVGGLGRVELVAHVTARTPGDALIRDAAATRISVIRPGLTVVVEASAASGRPGDTVTFTFVVTNTGDSVVRGISVVHEQLGIVGHIGALAPGGAVRLTSSEALSGAPTTLYETTIATGSDLSGSRVSARATTSLTVLATRGGSGHGGTAFTGSDVAGAGGAAIALLGLGGVALWVGFRERNHSVVR